MTTRSLPSQAETLLQFRDAIRATGIEPPDSIIPDGELHRFASSGKRGDEAGWYVLHLDDVPAGAFGCWRADMKGTWCADLGRPLTEAERTAQRQNVEAARKRQEAELAAERERAAKRAEAEWNAAGASGDSHPYLARKGVRAHGLRADADNRLLVPVRDANGKLHSLEYIHTDGSKKFLTGGRIRGCYYSIGAPTDVLCIAEGFATAASIHEATGYAVAVAFFAGNLKAVSEALRKKFPALRLIVCADDDCGKEHNAGVTKGREAAQAIGALLAVPDFGKDRPDGATDFNDLAQHCGRAAVQRCIQQAEPVACEPQPIPVEATRCAILTRGDTIKLEPIDWLWEGWLAAGKLHILAGAPGTGKTTIALAMAAAVTTGGRWPDRSPVARGSVVIWSGEDDPGDTLKPRLLAMEAELSRVHFVEAVAGLDGRSLPFDPARDVDALSVAMASLQDVRLLIVDPIVSAVAGDSHNNAETRRSLQPLVDLAARHRCALVGITHLSKGTAGRDPVERVSGSLAFGALARVVLLAAKQQAEGDRPAQRLLMRAKSNIGPDAGAYIYDLRQVDLIGHPGMAASSVLWGAALEGNARELLADAELPGDEERGEQRSAADWLRDLLADGPVAVAELKRHAKESGIAWRTLQRAMHGAGATSRRAGFGQPATWFLSSRANASPVAPVTPASESGANGATDGAGVIL